MNTGYFALISLILLLPAAFSIWFRCLVTKSERGDRGLDWITFRRRLHALILIGVPAWWSVVTHITAGQRFAFHLEKWVMLLVPSSAAIFITQWTVYWSDVRFLDRRWNSTDLFRLAAWSTISLPTPLLMVAAGIGDVRQGSLAGIFWEVLAGITAFVGTLRLRAAEGFKPRAVKSGEFYKRSMAMSHKLGIPLRQVCVVPFGRGRLSNAFGGLGTVMVTDDYGHWLNGPELEVVIGHELAHVKKKHLLKKLLAVPAVFLLTTFLAFFTPTSSEGWRVIFNFVLILTPVMSLYLLSRRFEYEADCGGLEATQQSEACIRALTNMRRHAGLPANCHWWEELFCTHPSFSRRIGALAKLGRLSADRVAEIAEPHERSSRRSTAMS